MKNISGRDIKIFLLGMLVVFLIVVTFEWKDFVRGFEEGYSSINKK